MSAHEKKDFAPGAFVAIGLTELFGHASTVPSGMIFFFTARPAKAHGHGSDK